MLDHKQVQESLLHDIETISSGFLEALNIKPEGKYRKYSNLENWIYFRERFISPVSRDVGYAQGLEGRVPVELRQVFCELVQKIRKGEDVNGHQSKGLEFNKHDGLWANWKLHHLHLSNELGDDNYFMKRSDYQLFCVFEDRYCLLVDVRPHPKNEGYADPELIDIINENWPNYLKDYELVGCKPDKKYTATEHFKLRNAGLTALLTVNDKAYIPPNWGITTAGTSLNVQNLVNQIKWNIEDLAKLVCEDEQFRPVKQDDYKYGLTLFDNKLVIYEVFSSTGFAGEVFEIFESLNTVFPDWLFNFLQAKL